MIISLVAFLCFVFLVLVTFTFGENIRNKVFGCIGFLLGAAMLIKHLGFPMPLSETGNVSYDAGANFGRLIAPCLGFLFLVAGIIALKKEVKYKDGNTPLHDVAMEGDQEIAELLIAKGADVNAKDNSRETSLLLAALLVVTLIMCVGLFMIMREFTHDDVLPNKLAHMIWHYSRGDFIFAD